MKKMVIIMGLALASIFGSMPANAEDLVLNSHAPSETSVLSVQVPLDEQVLDVLRENLLTGGVGIDEFGNCFVQTNEAGYEAIKRTIAPASFELLRFEVAEDISIQTTANFRGGYDLAGICTGGFLGTSGASIGVITAYHCFTDPYVNPTTYMGNTINSVIFSSSAPSVDIAFAVLSGTTDGLVKLSNLSVEPINSTAIAQAGTTYCRYGVSSGTACSKVTSTTYKFVRLGLSIPNLCITESDSSLPGDSGGPWYTSAPQGQKSAVGIHYGHVLVDGVYRSLFMPIGQLSQLSPIVSVYFPGIQ
jgi:hypothetical protein